MVGTHAAFKIEIHSIGTLKNLMEIRLQKRNFMNHDFQPVVLRVFHGIEFRSKSLFCYFRLFHFYGETALF